MVRKEKNAFRCLSVEMAGRHCPHGKNILIFKDFLISFVL